jgi:hypothetical protein
MDDRKGKKKENVTKEEGENKQKININASHNV